MQKRTFERHQKRKNGDERYNDSLCGRTTHWLRSNSATSYLSKATNYLTNNNCQVGSLRDGQSRLTLAEECFNRYIANKAKQGYTLIDLEAAKERYLKSFLNTYEEFASLRRGR